MEKNQIFPTKKGEEQFIKYFETHPHFEKIRKKEVVEEKETKEHIKNFIERLSEEIRSIPSIEREAEIHKENLGEISNILAQAVYLAVEEGLLEGLAFIKKFNNPHLLDAFHDLLVGHFFELLLQHGKIKISQ